MYYMHVIVLDFYCCNWILLSIVDGGSQFISRQIHRGSLAPVLFVPLLPMAPCTATSLSLRAATPSSLNCTHTLPRIPPYQESISNPVTSTKIRMLGSFWDISSLSSTNPANQKFTWSLPCRIHEGEIYGTQQEQAPWDPAEWEQHERKADLKGKIKEFDAGMGTPSGHTMKLSVREQPDSLSSRHWLISLPETLWIWTFLLFLIHSIVQGLLKKDKPPCIVITDTTPPPLLHHSINARDEPTPFTHVFSISHSPLLFSLPPDVLSYPFSFGSTTPLHLSQTTHLIPNYYPIFPETMPPPLNF